jgi:hypothetical protein
VSNVSEGDAYRDASHIDIVRRLIYVSTCTYHTVKALAAEYDRAMLEALRELARE